MPFGPRIIGQCLEPRVADALFFRIVSYVAMNIIGDKYFYVRQGRNRSTKQQKKKKQGSCKKHDHLTTSG